MKRTCLISSSLALAVLVPTVAVAEPAVLYIPTDPVTLTPLNTPPCGGSSNSALGCGGVSEQADIPPYAEADALTTAVSDGLAAYDVMVTNTRPPEYIPYVMLMADLDPADMSESFTCTSVGINCASRNRNALAFTSGSTMNCMDPDITHAAMYAFGRASGLEGIANPEDWMNYVPDYTTPPMGYQDSCSDRVQQNGFNDQGDPVMLPLECTSVDHFACDGPGGDAGQNSHQDLLAAYGDRTEDIDPPVFSNIVPEDGAVLMAGDAGVALLEIDVDIEDADIAVGARWTITSDALISDQFPEGVLSICTNDVCSVNWDDVSPAKATDSDWASPVDLNFPPGEYVITLEAADYHGNEAEMVTLTVTIEGDATGTSGPGDTGMDETGTVDPTNGSGFTSGDQTDGSGSTAGTTDDDGGGCSCSTGEGSNGTPAALLTLLGFMGLGAMRRRR